MFTLDAHNVVQHGLSLFTGMKPCTLKHLKHLQMFCKLLETCYLKNEHVYGMYSFLVVTLILEPLMAGKKKNINLFVLFGRTNIIIGKLKLYFS